MAETLQQVLCIEAIAPPCPIISHRTGGSRERNKCAGGCRHIGKPATSRTKAPDVGIVATRVQYQDADLRLRLLHRAQHESSVYRQVLGFCLGSDVLADGDEIVVSLDLHAVPGVVEQSHTRAP